MEKILFLIAIVIFFCIAFQRMLRKTGVPGLLIFILLGMLFGSDGLFKITFDNYSFANQLCSIALIFIMFYGGAGTKWSTARPIATKAILLSSIGTILTGGLVGLFCHYTLGFNWHEALLTGAVICSTDAASVFSILRSKKMNLKYNTAPLLEVESGSNDPFSYLLTIIVLTSITGGSYNISDMLLLLLSQVVIGIIGGVCFALIAKQILIRFDISDSILDTAFIVGIALIAYTVPYLLNGNGYLAVYIAGIILGNSQIPRKKAILNFLGGLTGLMQMFLFFLLGLLSFPSELPIVSVTAFSIALFLTFIARPLAIALLMTPFHSPLRQQLFIAWSGMRGAASIVFAIMAITGINSLTNDIFHIVFFIVLFSILIQGTLLPVVAKKLDMIDDNENVLKTFNDYTQEMPVEFLQFTLHQGHEWEGKKISDITLPPECIMALIIRNHEKVLPKGDTILKKGDTLVLGGKEGGEISTVYLYEKEVTKDDPWLGGRIMDVVPDKNLIILIIRKNNVIIPNGNTILYENDWLYISDR